jgi:hypothetical protein
MNYGYGSWVMIWDVGFVWPGVLASEHICMGSCFADFAKGSWLLGVDRELMIFLMLLY